MGKTLERGAPRVIALERFVQYTGMSLEDWGLRNALAVRVRADGAGDVLTGSESFALAGGDDEQSDAIRAAHFIAEDQAVLNVREAKYYGPAPHTGILCDWRTGRVLRAASPGELARSEAAAREDGGAGLIVIDGARCYVQLEDALSSEEIARESFALGDGDAHGAEDWYGDGVFARGALTRSGA